MQVERGETAKLALRPARPRGADRGAPHAGRGRRRARRRRARRRPRCADGRRRSATCAAGRRCSRSANGTHRVVIGTGDRVYEQQVTVGDLPGASALLPARRATTAPCSPAARRPSSPTCTATSRGEPGPRPGGPDASSRTCCAPSTTRSAARARRPRATTRPPAACRRRPSSAAASGGDAHHSATLFEQAGDFGRAAERYRETGDFAARPPRPTRRPSTTTRPSTATGARRRREGALELLEKIGRYFEAGQAALAAGDAERAIRNLQQVDLRDPDHGEACRTLAQLFAERGDLDLAAEKLARGDRRVGRRRRGAPRAARAARRSPRARRAAERALETFETIRKRDYT